MNIFKQLLSSLYSPQIVSKFRFQGIGKTILYIFVLMLITSSVIAYQVGSSISIGLNTFNAALQEDVPPFELKNKELHSDLEEPLYFSADGDQLIFDTTGSISFEDIKNHHDENVVAILQKEVIIKTNNSFETINYEDLGNITITKEQIEDIVSIIIDLLPLIISIVIVIIYIVLTALKFLGIFILSFIGFVIRQLHNVQLSYKQLWILSAYAVTLPTVFFAITDALYIYIPYSLTLYWLVAVIMLYLIVKEIPKSEEDQHE